LSSVKLTKGTKSFLKKLTPILAGAGVAQINIFIGTLFASFLPTGCITYIYCADRFVQLPLALFGISMGIVLLPEISEAIAKKRTTDLKNIQNKSLLFTLRLTLPCVVGLITLSYYMISILYGHGKFSDYAVEKTSQVLKIASLGLPAYVVTKIMASVLFAQKDSKTPLTAAMFSIGANILLSIILIFPFKEIGIVFANAIAGFVNVYVICKSRGWFTIEKGMINDILKIIVASIITLLSILFIKSFITAHSTLGELLVVFISCITGAGAYLYSLYILKDEAVRNIVKIIK
jgi:putative peptidoglycan lipid II flippase